MGFILTNPFLALGQIIVLLTKRGQKGLVIPLPPLTHTPASSSPSFIWHERA